MEKALNYYKNNIKAVNEKLSLNIFFNIEIYNCYFMCWNNVLFL